MLFFGCRNLFFSALYVSPEGLPFLVGVLRVCLVFSVVRFRLDPFCRPFSLQVVFSVLGPHWFCSLWMTGMFPQGIGGVVFVFVEEGLLVRRPQNRCRILGVH